MSSYVTVEEIQAGTGWSRAYIYKLASIHNWRKLRGRPVRYHIRDVMGPLDNEDTGTPPPRNP